MAQQFEQNEQLTLVEDHQLMPMAEPEAIAKGTVFLLSDMSSYITGKHIPIDGGRF